MSVQKALVLESKQGSFKVQTREKPTLLTGEILVKVQAAALNPVDWKIQAYGSFVSQYPAVLGTDISGDVVEVADGVEGFKAGDRVVFQGWFTNDYAGFQQYSKVPAEIAAKIPESISYSQAASVPLGLATAAIGLFSDVNIGLNPTFDPSIKHSGPTLVIGGSSSVGQYAIQLLKFAGFSPIIAYASGHHTEYLKSLGATHVIDRKSVATQDIPPEVKKLTNDPVKVVYDAISTPETQEAGYATLSESGHLAIVLEKKIKNVVDSKKVYHVFGSVHPEVNRPFGKVLYKNLSKLLQDGTIVPNKTEDLQDGLAGIPAGLERLQQDKVSGLKLIGLPQGTA